YRLHAVVSPIPSTSRPAGRRTTPAARPPATCPGPAQPDAADAHAPRARPQSLRHCPAVAAIMRLPPPPGTTAQPVGLILGLSRKRLVGSYWFLTATSRW